LRLLSRIELIGVVVLIAAVIAATAGSVSILTGERQETIASAKSNCQAIEQIKRFIREDAIAANKLTQSLKVSGFGADDKVQFQRRTEDTLRRFRAQDCRKLPLVEGS